jgi:hypothetical protein
MKPRGHNLDQSASGDTIRGSSSVGLKVKVVFIIAFNLIEHLYTRLNLVLSYGHT